MTSSSGLLAELLPESPLLADALAKLAPGAPEDMAANLQMVETHFELKGTSTRTHCYSLHSDGLGNPRVAQLITAIFERITDYAIPRRRVQEALQHYERTGSTSAVVRLTDEARTLFTRLSSPIRSSRAGPSSGGVAATTIF